MPSTTLLEIPPAEQAQMRAILRRARYGYLLAFHILLLCAAGRNPTEIAVFLFCSRSSVYRIVRAYRTGRLGVQINEDGHLSIAVQTTVLLPWLTRSLVPLLKAAPRAYGWCRTRWRRWSGGVRAWRGPACPRLFRSPRIGGRASFQDFPFAAMALSMKAPSAASLSNHPETHARTFPFCRTAQMGDR